jgi:hypothetical protein
MLEPETVVIVVFLYQTSYLFCMLILPSRIQGLDLAGLSLRHDKVSKQDLTRVSSSEFGQDVPQCLKDCTSAKDHTL